MISTLLSRASAIVLLLAGLALLFASDAVLPRLIPAFPHEAAWLGQLLAAGWLAVAALNWLNQSALLGGIYGRPVVLANTALYFVSAMVLLREATRGGRSTASLALLVPAVAFAAIYAWLLYRGPIESDVRRQRGQPAP